MSYGPPPTKTPYGDQDFIKEDWPVGGAAPGVQPPARPPAAPFTNQYPPPGSPYGQTTAPMAPMQQAPYGQPPAGGQHDPSLASGFSLTPEDQIFIRSWRQDSFYQRVLPFAAVLNGSYYYYCRTKQLPHKVIPHFMIASGAYILGKWTYRDELRRRVEASPSQTPFMASLRKIVGAQPLGGPMGEFTSDMSQDYMNSGFGSANVAPPPPPPLAPTSVNSAYTRRGQPYAPSQASYGSPGMQDSQSFQPADTFGAPPNDGVPLTTTSYEELRARNRGLIQK